MSCPQPSDTDELPESSKNELNIMIATEESNNEGSAHNNDEATENNEKKEENNELNKSSSRMKKTIIGIILIAFITFVIVDSLTTQYFRNAIEIFLEWVGNNPAAGIFGVIIVYFVATVLFIPGSLLTLGAGYIFSNSFGLTLGVVVGSLTVFIGATSGACAAFLLGRYLFRNWANKLTNKYAIFEALDVAFHENGFRIMILLRLSPIIPFNVINYIAGVTAITFWNYTLAMFGILPGTILYVFLGASASSLTDTATSGEDPTVMIIIVVVGIVFGVIAIGMTSYYAKKQLNRILEERNNAEENDNQSPQENDNVNNIDIEVGASNIRGGLESSC